jgi:hypothetical protein
VLYEIIMKCYQLKEAKGLKVLDWRQPQQRMQLLDILGSVRQMLAKLGHFVSPTVYFEKSISEETVAELTAMVESMKGRVVSDRNAVGLTHIVFPFGPNGDPDDGQVILRRIHSSHRVCVPFAFHTSHLPYEYLADSRATFDALGARSLPARGACFRSTCAHSVSVATRLLFITGMPLTAITNGLSFPWRQKR